MMVVLLIISIILAATAPIAAKKMARDRANAGNNPWVYTDNNGSVAFNLKGGDFSALIGTTRITNLPNGVRAPRLVLAGDAANPAFVFARRNGEYAGQINMTDNQVTMNGLTNGSGAVGANSVAIGMGQTHNNSSNTVTIGQGVQTLADNAIAIGQGALVKQDDDIAIGHNAKANENSTSNGPAAIAIGKESNAPSKQGIAIGTSASTAGNNLTHGGTTYKFENNIAIGTSSVSGAQGTIAIGNEAKAYGIHSIAIGNDARANSNNSGTSIESTNDNGIAIGNGARAKANNCVAIGLGAVNNTASSILLGRTDERQRPTVIIPGNLVVWGGITTNWLVDNGDMIVNGKHIVLGNPESDGDTFLLFGRSNFTDDNDPNGQPRWDRYHRSEENNEVMHATGAGSFSILGRTYNYNSDSRLKNIGEKYTSGLEALKKLDIYNFTFKNDKTKSPHVGVMAQDLEKVFPNSVNKDVYGYLRIRWDEMFYAVINAIKELDAKVSDIITKVTNHDDEITALKTEVKELRVQNAEFERRLAELEKK